MSEMEQLKKNADEARISQRTRELGEYMESIHTLIDKQIGQVRQAVLIFAGVLVATMILEFIINDIRLVLIDFMLCMAAWVFALYRERALQKSVGELKGALKVMKILGLIDFDWDDIGSKRRKRSSIEMVNLVKKWLNDKKVAQDKVYAPA